MYRSRLVDTLVTHANMKGLGLTLLFGDHRGYMSPQLKTKTKQNFFFALEGILSYASLFGLITIESYY